MTTLNLLIFYAICFVPTLIILPLFPYLTRKTISFGISIPEEVYNSNEVRKIRDSYRNNTLICLGIIAAASLLLLFRVPFETSFIIMIAGVFLQLIPVNIFYLRSHFRMKAMKAKNNWTADRPQMVVIDTDFRSKRTVMSPYWFLLHAVIILTTLVIGFAMYGSLPDKLPMHYNINGEVDRWADKSYNILFTMSIVQVIVSILMAFVYIMIRNSKQQVDASNPEKSIEQNRVFRYRWSGFAIFTGVGMLSMFGLIQLSILGLIPAKLIMPVSLVIPFAILAATIVLSITTGQGGSRVSMVQVKNKDGKTSKVISRDDDKYWKLGTFYFNPDDPTIFVEKRFGIGWDFNWARPVSWVILLGILALPVLIIVTTKLLEK